MNNNQSITSLENLQRILTTNTIVLLYFSTTSCSVGEALAPKVKNLVSTKFPKIRFFNVDINYLPDVAANFSAFVEPTILVFFYGKETIRKSRNIGIYELQEAIEKRYKLIFE
jgi:thiol-disulfide isomerase/thioredoxin